MFQAGNGLAAFPIPNQVQNSFGGRKIAFDATEYIGRGGELRIFGHELFFKGVSRNFQGDADGL